MSHRDQQVVAGVDGSDASMALLDWAASYAAIVGAGTLKVIKSRRAAGIDAGQQQPDDAHEHLPHQDPQHQADDQQGRHGSHHGPTRVRGARSRVRS